MKNTNFSISNESIAFQSGEYFRELTEAFKKLWAADLPSRSYSSLIASDEAQALLAVTKKFTNITCFFSTRWPNQGPATLSAPISPNHIFFDPRLKEYPDFLDMFSELHSKGRKTVVFGSVDVKKSWVEGYFAESKNELLYPTSFLSKGMCYGAQLTAEEAAAIWLHENGHNFTYYEYLTRVNTSNQVLQYLSLKRTAADPEQYHVAVHSVAKAINLTDEQRIALEQAKSGKDLAVISIAVLADQMRAEIGSDFYDASSCEQLADQFATRHGAGMALISALEKIGGLEAYQGNRSRWGVVVEVLKLVATTMAMFIGALSVVGVVVAVIYFFTLIMSVALRHKLSQSYDNSEFRPARVRQDLIERLKEPDLTAEEKKELVTTIEQLGEVVAHKKEYGDLSHYIALLVNSSYKKAYKYEMLQKQLEALASNDLFVKATKIGSL